MIQIVSQSVCLGLDAFYFRKQSTNLRFGMAGLLYSFCLIFKLGKSYNQNNYCKELISHRRPAFGVKIFPPAPCDLVLPIWTQDCTLPLRYGF